MKQGFRAFLYGALSASALGIFVLASGGCSGGGKGFTHSTAKKTSVDAQSVKCADLVRADCKRNAACFWDTSVTPNDCKDRKRTKYYSYNFDVLDSATTHGFNNAQITGVASSKDRAYVYVMKGSLGTAAEIKYSNDNGATWVAVKHLNDRGKPSNNLNVCDMSQNGVFNVYAPLTEGLIVQHGAGCIGIIRGDEVPTNSVWDWTVANLAGNHEPATSFFEATKAPDGVYIYATAANTPAAGVAFQSVVPPPLTNAWNKHVEMNGGGALTQLYTALAQAPNGFLIMGNKRGLFMVNAADVGVDGAQMVHAEITPSIVSADLSLDKGATANNQGISAITFVDNKYILVGLVAGEAVNRGGVTFADYTKDPMVWTPFGAGVTMTVRKIVVSGDNKGAVIVSDKGLVYFRDGKFVEMVPGQILVNQAVVNAHRASFKKASAKSGFGGALPTDDLLGAAEDASGNWYFGSAFGVIKLEIKEKDI